MRANALLESVARDPRYLLAQLDPVAGLAQFLEVDERVYRDSIFMDQRLKANRPRAHVLELWPTVAALEPLLTSRACHYLFHVGHCGSTMMSRAVEQLPGALALREPPPLRALARMRRELASPLSHVDDARYRSLRGFVGGLLARSFEPSGRNLVKASSDCSNLTDEMLALNPANRGLLMFIPLESFLAAMLRDAGKRRETAHFAASRLADLHRILGDDSIRLYELNDAHQAALSWVSNMAWLTAQDPARALLVDFEALLDDPVQGLAAACGFLGWEVARADLGALVRGPLFTTYAKDPESPYNPASRAAELREAEARFGDEIDQGLRWAEALCGRFEALHPLADHLRSQSLARD